MARPSASGPASEPVSWPGVARPRLTRQESKAQTRAEVLAAAGRLFLRDGFVATSLSAIAEEAGVTKGAVYSSFESKEDLFLTLVRGDGPERPSTRAALSLRDFERWGARAELEEFGRDTERRAPSARHVALFLEYNAFALRNKRSRDSVRDHNAEWFASSGATIDEAIGSDDGDDMAAIAQSLYVGLLLHRAVDPDRFGSDLFAKAFAMLARDDH